MIFFENRFPLFAIMRSNLLHHMRIGDHREQRGAADDVAEQYWHHELASNG
jgi:hypothetical protein